MRPRLAPLATLLALAPPWAFAAEPVTLGLPDALQALEAQAPAAALARSRAEEASALVRQSASALLPTLTAAGSFTANRDQAAIARPPSGQLLYIQAYETLAVAGTLRVPLLVPSAWADLAAARHGAASAEAGAEAARAGLRLAVVQGAWMETSAEEVLAAAERALATARDQARSARRAVDAGLQPPLSALASETQAVRREGDLVSARAALEKAQLALGVLLGRSERVRIPMALPAAPPREEAAALGAAALERRPEVRAQAEALAAAESQRTSARLRLLPQLAASGSLFAQDVPLPTGHKDGWQVLVQLTWPLYDGGLRYGKEREAQARIAGARAAAEAARLSVLQEVEDGARDLSVSAERLRLAEQQRALAADAAATARRGFDAGVTGNVEVLGANDELFQAEVGLARARAQLGQSAAALDRAAGRI
ncbi:MAG: TolC family protein [Deltaproteobacteria bacterium]|nr:TolC family protein [Deltaproteobacteria bacterium]